MSKNDFEEGILIIRKWSAGVLQKVEKRIRENYINDMNLKPAERFPSLLYVLISSL